jgi:hypothetical protein
MGKAADGLTVASLIDKPSAEAPPMTRDFEAERDELLVLSLTVTTVALLVAFSSRSIWTMRQTWCRLQQCRHLRATY